ncbi:MAG: Hint domain-containing protein [Paracoccaceae bacterium]|nr:Hint domain-containing protein [Paracoccaceae bacterium]
MPTYNVNGWIWSGTGSATTLLPVTISDDDPDLSPYFTDDFTETITISGTTYTNPSAGTYELTFTDSGATGHTEDFLLFYTGTNFIFIPLPGSNFDTGSVVTSLGGWQSWTAGFVWDTVTCFSAGTLIQTLMGPRQINSIEAGDLVETSSGLSPVVWVGHRHITSEELFENPKLRPVRITAGAMGNGLPKRDLIVSRQHRMLVQSKIAERMFGTKEVLISAIKLTALPGIFVDETIANVDYFHLLFDHHKVVFAEGAPSESLFTGPEALKSMSVEAREEITTIFPEIRELDYTTTPVRFIPQGKLQKNLVARHLKNRHPLVQDGFGFVSRHGL